MKSVHDSRWERKLNIQTAAGEYEKEDANHSRYEPTSYAVLERLAESGLIGKDSTVVDYGCGKGRVGFFLNYAVGCQTIGVEYSAMLFDAAQENLTRYCGRNAQDGRVSFVCRNAENYEVGDADCFYFFNPFSVRILQAVLRRIFESYYSNPREMKLFFYYALDPYLSCLMTESEIRFAEEIDCRDLFHNDDPREKIMVFAIG